MLQALSWWPDMSARVDLELIAGQPYARRFRVTGAAAVWPTLEDFEVRSQIRAGKTPTSSLRADFGQFITMSIDGVDIVGDISLTGAQTYNLRSGYYDIVLSDPGTTDARLVRVLFGEVKVSHMVTSPTDG